MDISPKYLMSLIKEIEIALWDLFPESKYKNVKNYIKKWSIEKHDNWSGISHNFIPYYKNDGNIDLYETLHWMDGELLLKIAVDLGVETPDFIPISSEIKNVLKWDYKRAYESFDKAIKQIEEDPDLAISMANSTLESIIKHILENADITTKYNPKDTLGKLCESLLKEFQMFPNSDLPSEVKTIGSSLISVANHIETLRSTKTRAHGKAKKDYLIDDPLYAYFIINSVSTVGLFLINFYEKKYSKKVETPPEINIPF